LREASVLGQVVDFEELRQMGGRGEQEVEEALEEAGQAGIMREGGHDQYHFNHALTLDTLYAELPARRKRRLHRAAADVIGRLPNHEARAAEVAYHLQAADESERALPYALLAGDHAEGVYAHAEAEGHYRAALRLAHELANPEREALALEKLAMVLIKRARYQEALAVVEDALLAYQTLGDVEGEGRVAEGLCLTHYPLLTPETGVVRLAPLLEELRARGLSPIGQARLDAALAYLLVQWAVNSHTGEEMALHCAEALAAAERGRELAQAAQNEGVLARALMSQGLALLWLGRYEEALTSFEALLPLAEAARDPETHRMGLALAGNIREISGDFQQSQEHLDRALALSEYASDPFDAAFAWGNHAELAYYRGDWGLARSSVERSLQIVRAHDLGARAFGTMSQCLLSMLYLAAGEHEQADALSAEPLAIAKERQDLQQLRVMHGPIAERHLLAGRAAAARVELEPLLERPGIPEPQALFVLPQYAWALLDLGEDADAESRAVQSCQQARAGHYPVMLVDGLRILALVLLRQQRWEEARTLLDESLETCQTIHYPYAELKALWVYGRLETARGDRTAAHERFSRALAICERLCEGLYRPHVERDLRALTQTETT
jgi:tetratricopeptide (TPR) repeat protein